MPKKIKFHRHHYHWSGWFGLMKARCTECPAVTKNPRWPFWKEGNR